MKIKICGLRRPEDVEFANEVRPDYAGFIMSPGYKRSITCMEAADLRNLLSGDIPAVGVFVNEDPERIAEFLNHGFIDIAQLHGSESDDDIKRIKDLTGCEVIKMIKPDSFASLDAAFASEADYLLFDNGAGTGRAFNHKPLRDYLKFRMFRLEKRFFIAGGITPENIKEVYKELHPYGVDLSSSLETDGVKDLEKMRAATLAVRRI
ncbi:MAG: phosphoribosylanthranilate isomerase [Lachnospiraceae bacterium]|nr:phosphoribosylanthranilate isomerase [Lachnospiraceae bacterium]